MASRSRTRDSQPHTPITPPLVLKKALLSDSDVHHFGLTHPKYLPLIASPLVEDAGIGSETTSQQPSRQATPPRNEKDVQEHHAPVKWASGEPPLRRAHESSTIQLFFDLFFVANLTTFTGVHEVNDGNTLKSYVGFFALLWLTWLHIAAYDVRFGSDSVLERIFKALQFGVMAGFAVVGPGYSVDGDPSSVEGAGALQAFRTMSIILMVSRLILVAEYGILLVWCRKWHKAILPLAAHCLVYFVVAMICLGLFFAFTPALDDRPLVGWYVVLGVEAVAILVISRPYRFMSFRPTCIVERLGLLTLIILGEGVIGLTRSIQTLGADRSFAPDIIGMIICGVVIVFSLFMLYFDQTETQRVGTVRQQIWILAHFPFHVSVLLTLEGVSQLAIWRKLVDIIVGLEGQFFDLPALIPENVNEVTEQLNTTLEAFYETFTETQGQQPKYDFPPYQETLQKFSTALSNGDAMAGNSTFDDLWSQAVGFAALTFGIRPPEHSNTTTATQEAEALGETLETVYAYFFIGAGFALLLTSLLFVLGKRKKVRGDWLSIGLRAAVGIALVLLCVMAFAPEDSLTGDRFITYMASAWMLPTVAIAYLVVVVVDNVLLNITRSIAQRMTFNANQSAA